MTDNRRSPVDDAQRLANIRDDGMIRGGVVEFLLDHIDALTAERDALRKVLLELEDSDSQWADLPFSYWWADNVRPLLEA